jgi:hypothetical protein
MIHASATRETPPLWSSSLAGELDRGLCQREDATERLRSIRPVGNESLEGPGLAIGVVKKDVLVLHYGAAFVGTLEHWHYDTFRVNWRDPVLIPEMATFVLGADGKCVGINVLIAFDDAREMVEFKKVAAKPKSVGEK